MTTNDVDLVQGCPQEQNIPTDEPTYVKNSEISTTLLSIYEPAMSCELVRTLLILLALLIIKNRDRS